MTAPPNRTPLGCFAAIFLADLLARTAYLGAKYPALTVFADDLGAGEVLLGTIVSVSVITGIFTKPLIGFLSDRVGLRLWLFAGTALFAAAPPLYLLVDDTATLVALRLFHGLATAIYGPVTLAFIAGLGDRPRAEWFGWFGLSRQGAAIAAPLIGGALLKVLDPAQVIAATSLIAVCAFAPAIYAAGGPPAAAPGRRLGGSLATSLIALVRNHQIAVFGAMELTSRIGVYAVKVFLPLAVIRNGGSALEAGAFLAVQEATVAAIRPVAGRIADQGGAARYVATSGLCTLAAGLCALPITLAAGGPWIVAISIGIGQGVYEPAALALIARSTRTSSHGLAYGAVGSLRNLGKVLGPVLGGALILATSFGQAFVLLGLVPGLGAVLLLHGSGRAGPLYPRPAHRHPVRAFAARHWKAILR